MVEFFIAIRHILERKFQSIFSILGVAIAVTVFIVSLTVSNGLEKNMISSLLTLSPHILIRNSQKSFFENYGDVIEKTKEIKDVKAVIPQINSQSIIRFNNFAKGVLAKGIDAKNVKNDLNLRILKGNNDISELASILIGEELSNEMKLKVGDELSLVSAENKELKLKVKGIFKTGFLDYDSNLVIVPLKTIQIISEQGEVATEIGIITGHPQKIEEVVEEVSKKETTKNTWRKDGMKGLSFNEQKEYNRLEKEIAQLEEQKASIEAAFAEGTLSNDEIQTQSIALQQTLTAIEEKTERWFELTEKLEQ